MIPAELHFHCQTAGSGEHLWIHFNLEPGRLEAFRQPFQLQGDAGSRALARELWRQLQAQPDPAKAACEVGQLHRSTHLAKALLHLLLGRLNLTARSHLPTQLQHALDAVHERLRQPLTVRELARLAGNSPEHLAHLFRQHLKQSPSAYMRAARIREAARRLAYSDDTIEAIAADLCFANRHHLSRVFKAVMREPPAAFRKRLRGRDT